MGGYICTRSIAMPFDEFTLGLHMAVRTTVPKERHAAITVSVDVAAMIREEFPWFTDDDIKVALQQQNNNRCKPKDGHADEPADRDEVVVPLSEDDAIAAVEELWAHRERWHDEDADGLNHFLRDGSWG